MGAAGGDLLGERVEGVGEGMGGSGNLAGGRGGRGEHFCPNKTLLLFLPLSSCEGRRGVWERTGGWRTRYEMLSECRSRGVQ